MNHTIIDKVYIQISVLLAEVQNITHLVIRLIDKVNALDEKFEHTEMTLENRINTTESILFEKINDLELTLNGMREWQEINLTEVFEPDTLIGNIDLPDSISSSAETVNLFSL